MDPHFSAPYTHSVDLAVEQQLSSSTSLTISYVGTRGMRLPFAPDANLPVWSGATRTYDVTTATGSTQSTVTVPFYPAGITKPSPNDGNISVIRSVLNTWYNAASFSLKQQMKYGFQALVNYTWSHTQDTGQISGSGGTFFGTDIILDPQNVREHYASSSINMTREAAKLGYRYAPSFRRFGTLFFENKPP